MSDGTANSSFSITLLAARERCARQGLLAQTLAGVSLRLPSEPQFLFVDATAAAPQLLSWREPPQQMPLAVHATIYQIRPDVGAVLSGSGLFGSALGDFGAVLPVGFDEQARHLGRMHGRSAAGSARELQKKLAGGANVALIGDLPICLGTTCQRLVLNAELFEKCAQAYVLAIATGQRVSTLPWWVCRIALRRLRKDQRRAAERFAQGLLPEEARGY